MGSNSVSISRSRFTASDLAYCGLFVALMVVGAKIHIMIPIGPGVTVSLQIMFALLAGFILGPMKGFVSVFVYLLIGLLGLPVYAHGGGLFYLLKPTYGFLIGFATAAPIAGALMKALKKRSAINYLIAGELGMFSYYVCGLLYFYVLSNFLLADAQPIGIKELFVVWFFSSVGPDIVIAAVASLLAHRLVPIFLKMKN